VRLSERIQALATDQDLPALSVEVAAALRPQSTSRDF
jgi:hypothetical protein